MCSIFDVNHVKNLVEVIRRDTVTRPLREESNCHDDPHALSVARSLDERHPANVSSNISVEVEGGSDLFELVLD